MRKTWLFVALILSVGLLITGCKNGSDPVDTAITFTVVQQQGIMNKKDTVSLYLVFSTTMARESNGGMKLNDIIITDAGGSVIKTGWSQGTQPARTVNVDVAEQGEVKVKVNFPGVTTEEQTVFVCKKLGFRPDAAVTINEIILMNDLDGAGNTVSFGRYDGDPAAVLAPATYEPVIRSSDIGLEHVIAKFNPPLDLRNSSEGVLRWFDMLWEGFGSSWIFENASGGPETPGARPGVNPTTSWALHNVVFQLELLVDNGGADGIVIYETKNEINTSTGAKKPVRFDTVKISGGSLPWDTGYIVKAMTLRVADIQLRTGQPTDPDEALANKDWRALSANRNADFTDMYITSLTAEFAVPPPIIVLFDNSKIPQWHSGITSASFGVRGDVEVAHATSDAMTNPISKTDPSDQLQMIIKWDPPFNATSPTAVPYSSIKFSYTEDDAAEIDFANWYGYGTYIANTTGGTTTYTKNYGDDGGGGTPASVTIPLSSEKYSSTDVTKMVGILIQGGGEFTVTKIWIE